MDLKKGIEKGVEMIVDELKKLSKNVSSQAEIAQVASISANDQEIGKVIAEIIPHGDAEKERVIARLIAYSPDMYEALSGGVTALSQVNGKL